MIVQASVSAASIISAILPAYGKRSDEGFILGVKQQPKILVEIMGREISQAFPADSPQDVSRGITKYTSAEKTKFTQKEPLAVAECLARKKAWEENYACMDKGELPPPFMGALQPRPFPAIACSCEHNSTD